MKTAEFYRQALNLDTHVEGGYFLETYRSKTLVGEGTEKRAASTGIYFMLEHGNFSAFHKIDADEMWHFYDGNPLSIYEIDPNGTLITHRLGLDLLNGERPQLIISAGNWFASRCETEGGFSFVGCTVSPGFEYSKFQLATEDLIKKYPQHSTLIRELLRQ